MVPRARLLPSGPREGIVVNLGDLRLYYFETGKPAARLPDRHRQGRLRDAHGRHRGEGEAREADLDPGAVGARAMAMPARVEPGPDNPLGEYALYLGWPGYLIHGTNDPRGVGRHSSRGCIRLYPDHIAELFGACSRVRRCAW